MAKRKRAERPAKTDTAVPAPSVRKGYEAAQHPEPQGDGDPGPDTKEPAASKPASSGA